MLLIKSFEKKACGQADSTAERNIQENNSGIKQKTPKEMV